MLSFSINIFIALAIQYHRSSHQLAVVELALEYLTVLLQDALAVVYPFAEPALVDFV